MVTFYKSEKVTEHISAIRSMTGEIMYLIEGSERSVLIDTCLGVGHLRDFVEKMTVKPITVLLSHGHIDHALGAPEFDDVYMNEADKDLFIAMSPLEERNGYIAANLGGKLPDFTEEDYVMSAEPDFKALNEGDSFDLGGIHIDVYALKGHTQGSMVFLIREERILILGDACNKSTFLFDENTLYVDEYHDELVRVRDELEGKYDRVFICHHDMEMQKNVIQNVIDVCEDIRSGNTDDVPFNFMGGSYFIAKAVGERMNRLDGIDGNIIYSKDRVRR